MWTLIKYQDGVWTRYELRRDGVLAGTARWQAMTPEHVQLHNEIITASPETIKEARKAMRQIIQDVKAAGHRTISVTATYDAKMMRYWRLMGFVVFGATMEV